MRAKPGNQEVQHKEPETLFGYVWLGLFRIVQGFVMLLLGVCWQSCDPKARGLEQEGAVEASPMHKPRMVGKQGSEPFETK